MNVILKAFLEQLNKPYTDKADVPQFYKSDFINRHLIRRVEIRASTGNIPLFITGLL